MLRDEKNAQYRQLIKNTLEYNPQILKRYVNFMNNPDEETAVEQFGKGDKYFGVATLMATLPGLPMVGHGQVEGFSEKYGMEYYRAKWQERPDQQLVKRHQLQIFPLFHRRRLFAEVENFLLYDFFSQSGYVNEDVFAFSNKLGEQRALVVYHNRFGDTRGWIKSSAAYLESSPTNGEKILRQRSLGDGLEIPNDKNCYIIFRNLVTDMEYIRNCAEIHEKGLFIELFAYQAFVFLDFRFVYDSTDGRYARVNAYLGGKPVPSIDQSLQEMFLQIIHAPYRELVNAGMLKFLADSRQKERQSLPGSMALDQVEYKSLHLLRAIASFLGVSQDVSDIAQLLRTHADVILRLPLLAEQVQLPKSKKIQSLSAKINAFLGSDSTNWAILLTSTFTSILGLVSAPGSRVDAALISQAWLDEWLLRNVIRQESQNLGLSEMGANYVVDLVRLMIGQRRWIDLKASNKKKPATTMAAWLEDPAIRTFLQINTYNDVEWFNQEAMAVWLRWMLILGVVDVLTDDQIPAEEQPAQLLAVYAIIDTLEQAVDQSGYQLAKLIENLKG